MSLANMVRRMADAGAPPEAIAIALEEIEAVQAALDARRVADRDRKREQRQRQKSADVTGHSEDSPETVAGQSGTTPSPDKSPPDPQKLTPTPHTHTGVARAREAEPFPKPDWADAQVWRDFLANRRKKNLTNSPTAYRKFLADIDRHTDDDWPPGRLLEAATARGWGAIYDGCKDELNGQGNHHHRQQPTSAWGAARDRVRLLPG